MANTTPLYALTPRADAITLNTATLGLRTNGSTGSTSLMASGASGTKIVSVWAKTMTANGSTNTATNIYIYYGVTASGAGSATLIGEILIPAVATSATVAAANGLFSFANFQLPTGYSIWVSSSAKTDLSTASLPNIVVGVIGGDF